MKRCGGQQNSAIQNQDEALERVRAVMKEVDSREELVAFCDNEKSFAEVIGAVRRAKVVIGDHGGAITNLLFAIPSCDTHVIELTSSAAKGKGGAPYPTHYTGGAGALFSYKLVLMEDKHAHTRIKLDDFETALRQVWYHAKDKEVEM